MAFPRRRLSGESLTPPRPSFFVSENQSTSSDDPNSDSDSDHPPPPPRVINRRKRSSMSHSTSSRPPPSSFAFPFQAYPGNPDPLPRRSSFDSAMRHPPASSDSYPPLTHTGSLTDLRKPVAPFMDPKNTLPRSSSSNSIYKQSVAANMMSDASSLPRNSSVHSFRAPFLSPASRPTSSLWSPPSYNTQNVVPLPHSANASTTALPFPKSKPPLPSTRLPAPLEKSEKPWLTTPEPRTRLSYFITLFCFFLGAAGAAIFCWRGIVETQALILPSSSLCQVLDDDFSSPTLDTSTWERQVQLDGFGNGEFEMTTADSTNLFFRNSQLYIYPTLTSDTVSHVLDGGNYTLPGCTAANKTACLAISSNARGTVINPVMSARINTKEKVGIKFGKVQIRAKLPRGDWLHPQILLLPTSSTYGPFPLSGLMTLLSARGNAPSPSYPNLGSDHATSSLTLGPFPALISSLYGVVSAARRAPFSSAFHVYTLEWTEDFIRFSVDDRTRTVLLTQTPYGGKGKKGSYWDKAGFPETALNGSDSKVVVQNPYAGQGRAAPFDQTFYLTIALGAGGTSGWFPDGMGGTPGQPHAKPWSDGSETAMRDFAKAQDDWASTWPGEEDRSFRIDYVKMWEKCR